MTVVIFSRLQQSHIDLAHPESALSGEHPRYTVYAKNPDSGFLKHVYNILDRAGKLKSAMFLDPSMYSGWPKSWTTKIQITPKSERNWDRISAFGFWTFGLFEPQYEFEPVQISDIQAYMVQLSEIQIESCLHICIYIPRQAIISSPPQP